tara:strand:- start:171 stop:338 length:168 start_codon:yes stop_codon:yes gene_type:complete
MFNRNAITVLVQERRAYIDNDIIVTRIAISALKRDYALELKRLSDKLQELEEDRG